MWWEQGKDWRGNVRCYQSAHLCLSGSERSDKPTSSLHRHGCNELHWINYSHHREEGDCLAMLVSVVFHRWEQSLLHSHLQQEKTMAHTSHFPTREQGVHNVWTSSKPAMPQVTAFAGASPRLPRIKAKHTLRVTRPTRLGLLSWGFFSLWFVLRAPSISQWWSRTAGYLLFRWQLQRVFLQQSLHCDERQRWKHKCCFE